MKLSEDTINEIIRLKDKGYSSRDIAKQLQIGKTSVNDYYAKYVAQIKQGSDPKQPKILFFDLEILPSIVATFGRFKQNIGHDNVITEGGTIVSVAWKFLGDSKVSSEAMYPSEIKEGNDYRITKLLHDLFEESDVVVAHNAPFDMSCFRARLAIHQIPMHRKVKVIDTLKIAKASRFNSRKLDSLCDYFDIGRKMQHSGIHLWISCMNGNQEAIDTMREYNEQDIVLLEALWQKLKGYQNNPVNLGILYDDNETRCPCCGSTNLTPTGNKVSTQVSVFDEYLCNECGYRSRNRKRLLPSEKRTNLLS